MSLNMRWPNVFFAGLFMVLLSSGCTEPNDLKCTGANDPTCSQFPGSICKLVSNPGDKEKWRCLPADGKCEAKVGVYLNTMACGSEKPICGTACTNMSCDCATCADFPAQENQTCATAASATPFCDKAAKRCLECGIDSGVQVGCAGTTPICDGNKCRACANHNDCKLGNGPGICKLPEYGVPNTGACVTAEEVTVVTTGAELNTAINDPNKTFVQARPGMYSPILVQTANVNKIIVGPGREALPAAQISKDGSGSSIVFGALGRVLFDGLRFSGNATCEKNSDLTILRSIVNTSDMVNGIDAPDTRCRSLTVGYSQIQNASNYGIFIGQNTDYRIFDNLVIDTAKTSATSGVIINSSKKGPQIYFAFNTVTRNVNGGVKCGDASNSPELLSSIIIGNGQGAQFSGMCTLKDTATSSVTFTGSGLEPTDYRLKDTNQACCSAKTNVDPRVPTDFFGVTRGSRVSGKTDVGFAESP